MLNSRVERGFLVVMGLLVMGGSVAWVCYKSHRVEAARNDIELARRSIQVDFAPFILKRAEGQLSAERYSEVSAQHEICEADGNYFPFYSACLLRMLEEHREKKGTSGIMPIWSDNALARLIFVIVGADTRLNRLQKRVTDREPIDAVLSDLEKFKRDVARMYKEAQ